MNSPFKTVALIGKHKNPEIVAPLLRLGEYLETRDLEVLLDSLTAATTAQEKSSRNSRRYGW